MYIRIPIMERTTIKVGANFNNIISPVDLTVSNAVVTALLNERGPFGIMIVKHLSDMSIQFGGYSLELPRELYEILIRMDPLNRYSIYYIIIEALRRKLANTLEGNELIQRYINAVESDCGGIESFCRKVDALKAEGRVGEIYNMLGITRRTSEKLSKAGFVLGIISAVTFGGLIFTEIIGLILSIIGAVRSYKRRYLYKMSKPVWGIVLNIFAILMMLEFIVVMVADISSTSDISDAGKSELSATSAPAVSATYLPPSATPLPIKSATNYTKGIITDAGYENEYFGIRFTPSGNIEMRTAEELEITDDQELKSFEAAAIDNGTGNFIYISTGTYIGGGSDKDIAESFRDSSEMLKGVAITEGVHEAEFIGETWQSLSGYIVDDSETSLTLYMKFVGGKGLFVCVYYDTGDMDSALPLMRGFSKY